MIPLESTGLPHSGARPERTALPLYRSLLDEPDATEPGLAKQFLEEQLALAAELPYPMPSNPAQLLQWVADNAAAVGRQYSEYLALRHAGAPRRFFSNKAHALYFLQQVAPSKLVDGAWLFGTVRHAADWRYHGLIRTYLEELGDGDPSLNHVTLYRALLAEHDCLATHELADELYLQGAIQLALGQASEDFLPEVIGYNLGYEQLPLHLLITAFELNELGIDPYYFTLHVTIDNAGTGHAHKAVAAVLDMLPGGADNAAFLQKLRAGYNLNDLGIGSTAVIEGFDLDHEVVQMLERKRGFGQYMHSDYCRLEGKTVNEWLAKPGHCDDFLTALENKGWIKRHQDPKASRFWQMLDGPGAPMFGVFNGYERQLLKDWIAGDWLDDKSGVSNPFRARFRRRGPLVANPTGVTSPAESTQALIRKMSPSLHASPEGLEATRAFTQRLSEGVLSHEY
ncbi:iron-containing redox enzyme family protein [Pseudomonas sp. CFBP 8770]|uniref:iron-containing redox enzyme family protein n=1 Tax=unclassified Pseudomonas TaxID=196821 RepID=UPI0017815A1E|nr:MULTISPECIES: iron-containing redox enzyme family protein [unclassified Pseudomonas]MBD8472847.1 iron-containing redox enzyme family protein [Pseudomonas sp. CFBP 8773]MBD8646050.1 iron-containing redox enzyme family protein [Pseudomonas sp. CFBP 8770]